MTAAVVAALVARLLAPPGPGPAVSVAVGPTLACVALTAAETHAGGRHAFACVNRSSGEILGALLARNGRPVCGLSGAADASGCYAIVGCGVDVAGCPWGG